ARGGIGRDKAVGEEICAVTIAAVEIRLGRLGGGINNPTLVIQRLTAPGHEASGGFVGFSGPRIVTQFSRTRNQMEYPAPQTASDIECANRSWATDAADDQQVLIGNARCVQANARCPLHIQARAKMNGTILAEAPDRLAG